MFPVNGFDIGHNLVTDVPFDRDALLQLARGHQPQRLVAGGKTYAAFPLIAEADTETVRCLFVEGDPDAMAWGAALADEAQMMWLRRGSDGNIVVTLPHWLGALRGGGRSQ